MLATEIAAGRALTDRDVDGALPWCSGAIGPRRDGRLEARPLAVPPWGARIPAGKQALVLARAGWRWRPGAK